MKARILDSDVSVYADASYRSCLLTKLLPGTVVSLNKCGGDTDQGWLKTTLPDGRTGYVFDRVGLDYLEIPNESADAAPLVAKVNGDHQDMKTDIPTCRDGRISILRCVVFGLLIFFSVAFIRLGGPLSPEMVASSNLNSWLSSSQGFGSSVRPLFDEQKAGLNREVADRLSTLTQPEFFVLLITGASFLPIFRRREMPSKVGNLVSFDSECSSTSEELDANIGKIEFKAKPHNMQLFLRTVSYVWIFALVWHFLFSVVTTADVDQLFYRLKIGSESGAVWALVWGVVVTMTSGAVRGSKPAQG